MRFKKYWIFKKHFGNQTSNLNVYKIMSKSRYEISEKYGLFRVREHSALHVEADLHDYGGGHNLSALDCVETAPTKNELRTYLEEHKEDFHGDRFVVLPIFDVEFTVDWD